MRAFWSVKDAGGGAKSAHWEILVSGHSNFGTDQKNIVSYESWHLQLKFETSLRSLRLIVWPQEVLEVTEVKMKKINSEIFLGWKIWHIKFFFFWSELLKAIFFARMQCPKNEWPLSAPPMAYFYHPQPYPYLMSCLSSCHINPKARGFCEVFFLEKWTNFLSNEDLGISYKS